MRHSTCQLVQFSWRPLRQFCRAKGGWPPLVLRSQRIAILRGCMSGYRGALCTAHIPHSVRCTRCTTCTTDVLCTRARQKVCGTASVLRVLEGPFSKNCPQIWYIFINHLADGSYLFVHSAKRFLWENMKRVSCQIEIQFCGLKLTRDKVIIYV